ncbi:MAG: hypothetical protein ACRECX_10520 [Methyloceanibacter sp.]|uniref:hypothetical protein n=1 Tax=Methyloceanibacter sp. TaxID=1965321 RepID=UPI003D6D9A74
MQAKFAAPVAIALATVIAFAATSASALTVLAQATTGEKAQTAPALKAPTTKLKPTGPTGGVKGTTGGTVAELSTQDCKNVGGTVVGVADDRCGASRQYCRMPDTNAVCIDKVN